MKAGARVFIPRLPGRDNVEGEYRFVGLNPYDDTQGVFVRPYGVAIVTPMDVVTVLT